jgi:hypothetical protein
MTTNEVSAPAGSETGDGRRLCSATSRSGRPCGAPCLRGEDHCYMHSATTAEARRAAQRRGGVTTHARRALLLGRIDFTNAESILAFRQSLVAAVLTGQVVAQRASVALTAAKDAEAAFVGQALEARLDALEGRIQSLVERRFVPDGGETP